MKTINEMVREAGFPKWDDHEPVTVDMYERFAELVRADEREVLHSLETDAHFIFNNPPGETSQDVRDVIEWYAASIRARGETK
jgi:hypothetical protein